ncbi:MAG: AAA family ATPase [Chromatiales bacterium]|nr:AAA family ATPase [Chromatiales bacterium]
MNAASSILAKIGKDLDLPASGSWPATRHLLDQVSAKALIAALAANRPLLVRGEPGVGKSQLARAAAVLLGRRFISSVIQPNTEYQELLWMFDHTQRLADAQMAGATGDIAHIKEADRYIAPGPLWYALDWAGAHDKQNHQNYRPPLDEGAPDAASQGVVLLIDEIDKADISLANGLLEVLGNGRFDVQANGEVVQSKGQVPLVVLTSNDTRELPAAMVRRCVVLDIKLPAGDGLVQHLARVGQTHFKHMDPQILIQAAEQIVTDRGRCMDGPKTGQAEYLDLLRALDSLRDGPKSQSEWLDELGSYFQKSRTQR